MRSHRVFLGSMLSLTALGAGAAAVTPPTRTLVFTLKAPVMTPAGARLFVTGNIAALCNWGPSCLKAYPIDAWDYQARVEIPASITSLDFKVTRGDWNTDASDSLSRGIPNFHLDIPVGSPQQIEFVANLIHWRDLPPLGVTGDLRLFPNFYSPQLGNQRTVRVWLPPGYGRAADRPYPVIYMHDGQNLFDPRTSGSGVEWSVDETLTAMIARGEAEEAIVVGVDCTVDRFDEYDDTTRGELYAHFLIDTVKPWVDKTFRTIPERESTFTMGSSMGALISMALIWNHSDVFSKAAGLSLPASIRNNASYRIVDATAAPLAPVQLYVDYGDYGTDAPYPVPGEDFLSHMLARGFPPSELTHQIFHYADHFEADWARRLSIPLGWLLGVKTKMGPPRP